MLLKKLKILLVEDSPLDAELICREIKIAQIICETLVVDCKADYIKALDKFSPDIILSDHTLPSFSSLEALKIAFEKLAKVPFILVTGTMSEDFAVKVMKEGAWDYVSKNQLQKLPDAIINAIDKFNYEKLRQKFLYDLILNEAYMQEAERIASYGSWELDVISKKLKLSKEAQYILGYEQNESRTSLESILNIVHPDELSRVRHVVRQILNNSDPDVYKEIIRLIDTDGQYRAVKTKFVLSFNSQRKLVRVNGFVQNVTDSMAIEDMIFESEQRFNCLAESINDAAVFSLNASGYVINSNKEARRIFGYTETEMNNKHISIIYRNQEINNIELISHLKLRNETGRLETKSCFAAKDGSRLWIDTTLTALNNNAGKLSGFIMILRKTIHPVFAGAIV